MSFEGLLTFVAVILAAWGVAGPLQRRAFLLFSSGWWLASAVAGAFLLLAVRDAPVGPARGPITAFLLTLGAFLLPVLAALWCGIKWYGARLSRGKAGRFAGLVEAAAADHQYSELVRILRKSLDPKRPEGLREVLPDASSVLFSAAVVEGLERTSPDLPLEILSDLKTLEAVRDRRRAVDAVVMIRVVWHC